MDNNSNSYSLNGYDYEKNDLGQIIHAEGQLRLEEGERNISAQRAAGGKFRRDSDDGGHLIGTRFGGSGEADNIVAEDRYINRGSFKSLENSWAKELNEGKSVSVEVDPIYHGQSTRPDIITAKTEVIQNNKSEIDYYSVTNENLDLPEFQLPEEADEMMGLWDKRENDMAKTLTLTNNEFRKPTNEELLASGEEAIDRHMEILRDEMRNDGMEDGEEMESIISAKREESMSELRDGIFPSEGESKHIESINDKNETETFEISSGSNGNNDNSFEEASIIDENSSSYDLDNSFTANESINADFYESVESSTFYNDNSLISTDSMDSSITDSMSSSITDSMDFSRGE